MRCGAGAQGLEPVANELPERLGLRDRMRSETTSPDFVLSQC
jgi:hypothetical protein